MLVQPEGVSSSQKWEGVGVKLRDLPSSHIQPHLSSVAKEHFKSLLHEWAVVKRKLLTISIAINEMNSYMLRLAQQKQQKNLAQMFV